MARVLVIDDERAIGHVIRLLLEAQGHEVFVADDGSRGFALAQRQTPDVVILDVMAIADHLVRMVKAVELLGAKCFVTGIRPAVAQTLIGIGVDLGSMKTLRSLSHASRTRRTCSRAPRR